MVNTPVFGVLGMFKQRLGVFAMTAFLLETSIISWSIRRRRILQQRENRDRISLALTNYSLR